MDNHALRSSAYLPHTGTTLLTIDPVQLRQFHQAHFPGRDIPQTSLRNDQQEQDEQDQQDDHELGYYPDGVKRTLTDEQIRMFRHSEIQRLLSKRRLAQGNNTKEERRQQGKQERNAPRPPRFDDEPVQQPHDVDTLVYDDDTTVEQVQTNSNEQKFLWPTLGV